ncbi:hypothetical protein BH10PSE16_BH10PSE16_40730 [soil metagenome]
MGQAPEQHAVQGSAAVQAIKRPAFQFYPADWRKDSALQSCSIAAQGLWINILCIAHQCEPYGHLTINKKPMSGAQIGRLVGLSGKECDKLIVELEDAGVVSRTDEGALFSRRMVRDEALRNKRITNGEGGKEYGVLGAEHGKKGGRPPKVRGVIYPPSEPQDSDGWGVILKTAVTQSMRAGLAGARAAMGG